LWYSKRKEIYLGDLRDKQFQGGGNESHGRRSKVKKCKRGEEGGCGF
jgi:hypothetical protein